MTRSLASSVSDGGTSVYPLWCWIFPPLSKGGPDAFSLLLGSLGDPLRYAIENAGSLDPGGVTITQVRALKVFLG